MANYISELFPVSSDNLNWDCFKLDAEIEREVGNRLSWRFSQQLENTIVVWYGDKFWVLSMVDRILPRLEDYHNTLSIIQEDLKKDIGDRIFSIDQLIEEKNILPSEVIAEFAIGILRHGRAFDNILIHKDKKGIEVSRQADYWAESFLSTNDSVKPAIAITATTKIVYAGNVIKFHSEYYKDIDIESFLMDTLNVNPIGSNGNAIVSKIVGQMSTHRDRLLTLAKEREIQNLIHSAPEEEIVVSIIFKGDKKEYHYPISALSPSVNPKTASKLNIDYGELLKKTKINYRDRLAFIQASKPKAIEKLSKYGLSLDNSVNSKTHLSKFITYPYQLDMTGILFGNNYLGTYNSTLSGLKQGGVYRRHSDFENSEQKIRISILKVGKSPIDVSIVEKAIAELARYRFNAILVVRKSIQFESISVAENRAQTEQIIAELLTIPTDLVFVILPTSDRINDEHSEGSFYSFISRQILCQGTASQAIYEDTIIKANGNFSNILNNIVPGILAKLGNLPYVLSDPLEIADYFIGFDVSRIAKKNSKGSRNVCAAVRVYGSQGEFVSYNTDTDATEGEEIDRRILEKFLLAKDLKGKRVLIYRDGRFRGDEVKHFLNRASAIESEFILVECVKSKIPRLYKLDNSNLSKPPKGLWLQLSSRELILVTTDVSESVGVPKPIRLKVVNQDGQKVSLPKLVEATLKLTLLHHGSLKPPGLPIPIFGADRIAYRVLIGNAPTILDGDKQWWL
jgi:Piwi domain